MSTAVFAREVCVADWGTTGFRLWRLSGAAEVLAAKRGALGMSRLRPGDYPAVLEDALREVGAAADAPVIICGMAGAAQGWVEARYLDLPVAAADLAAAAIRVPHDARPVFILPGVARRDAKAPDVMRGEETMLCGAIAEAGLQGRVCLPGTHSKWADIENRRLVSFATAMTGELFALLAQRSTLSHYVDEIIGDVSGTQAFADAVGESLRRPQAILQSLFTLRSRPLVFGAETVADNAPRLSGLLIGLELAGRSLREGDSVTLVSSGAIADTYAKALSIAGATARRLDAEHFALRGLIHAAGHVLAGEPA